MNRKEKPLTKSIALAVSAFLLLAPAASAQRLVSIQAPAAPMAALPGVAAAPQALPAQFPNAALSGAQSVRPLQALSSLPDAARGVVATALSRPSAIQGRSARIGSVGALRGLNSALEDKNRDADAAFRSRYDGSEEAASATAADASTGLLGMLSSLFRRKPKAEAFVPQTLDERIVRRYEVPSRRLRWTPSAEELKSTDELGGGELTIFGQDAAVKSLRFGLEIPQRGYNIFITGPAGSGRTTITNRIAKEIMATREAAKDKVSVFDFDPEAEGSRTIELEAGQSEGFSEAMGTLKGAIQEAIPEAANEVQQAMQSEFEAIHARRDEALGEIKARVAAAPVGDFEGLGMQLVETQRGFTISLTHNGELIRPTPEKNIFEIAVEKGAIQEDQAGEFERAMEEAAAPFVDELKQALQRVQTELADPYNERLKAAQKEALGAKYDELTAAIRQAYPGEGVQSYLNELRGFTLENWMEIAQGESSGGAPAMAQLPGGLGMVLGGGGPSGPSAISAYDAEVMVANRACCGAPVIHEEHPTYENVIGEFDSKGNLVPGSLLRADGGVLIMDGMKALSQPGVLPALVQALETGEVEVSEEKPGMILLGKQGPPKKQKVKVNTKVALIGDPMFAMMIAHYVPELAKLFKTRAQFNARVPNTRENRAHYMEVVGKLVRAGAYNLLNLSKEAVGKILEYSVILSGSQEKLSMQFGQVASHIAEASYLARKDGSEQITAEHEVQARLDRIERVSQRDKAMREYHLNGFFKIDTEGRKVGHVNALAVSAAMDGFRAVEDRVRREFKIGAGAPLLSDEVAGAMFAANPGLKADVADAFGSIMKVTVKTGAGRPGLTWVDETAGLIGSSSKQAIENIKGFLLGRFGQKHPVSAQIRVKFEQMYSGLDGDSATVAKTLAILSSLSGLPIRQDLAVTGSMSQDGEVQVIGGENHKIIGFWKLAKARGLTGTQGVVIPEGNMDGLMLPEEMIQDIAEGRFHIYGVRTIDEAVDIFFGIKAGGISGRNGAWEKGTVNAAVEQRLQELHKASRG